jgi:hypothetical protein
MREAVETETDARFATSLMVTKTNNLLKWALSRCETHSA